VRIDVKKFVFPLAIAMLGIVSLASRMIVPNAEAATGNLSIVAFATTETKDWASLADGAGASEDMVAEGAVLGDYCLASMSVDIQGMILSCAVKSANTVTVRLQNESGGTVDLASGSLRALVLKKPATGRGS
jgi:hypothetical protein